MQRDRTGCGNGRPFTTTAPLRPGASAALAGTESARLAAKPAGGWPRRPRAAVSGGRACPYRATSCRTSQASTSGPMSSTALATYSPPSRCLAGHTADGPNAQRTLGLWDPRAESTPETLYTLKRSPLSGTIAPFHPLSTVWRTSQEREFARRSPTQCARQPFNARARTHLNASHELPKKLAHYVQPGRSSRSPDSRVVSSDY